MRRTWAVPAALALLVALFAGGSAHAAGEGAYTDVSILDDVFSPRIVRVPVGGIVEWTNDGRSLRDVVADDGSWRSPKLRPGETFEHRFDQMGAFPYHCSFHGAPGAGMTGTIVVGDAPIPGTAVGVGPGRETPPSAPAPTVRVPQDAPTIQAAVDRAQPGGLVLISPGVYVEAVVVTTPFVTIRGTDRNRVILDGDFRLDNGIQVIEADGVTLENMTARHYLLDGFLWSSVFGYRGSYLTAYDDGDYGMFAYASEYGQFDHSYASGHPDSGFYIGQCDPCHAVITDVAAEHNALGFSGTNASGDLSIVNSEWAYNMAGILPNTLDSELLAPQHGVLIAGNVVHDNDDRSAPAEPLQYPAFGIGIGITGGIGNLVAGNVVTAQERFGIAVFPMLDRSFWPTSDNVVRDNRVSDSGIADLVLSGPSAGGDCFERNTYSTSLPAAIQWQFGCSSPLRRLGGGNLGTTFASFSLYVDAMDGHFPHGDWKTAPEPGPQPQMPGAELAPPDPAVAEVAVPETFHIRTPEPPLVVLDREEMSVLGFPLATSWWALLLGLYAYALPIVLYCAWVSIALWDIARQDAVPNGRRIVWMIVVLAVPLAGPIGYFALGRSPIQPSLRLTLVVGALVVYVALAVLGFVVGS
ncbi:MAG TPA: PLDc N-terminal domain-containing protein [Actinomycetota bacterium]|nr:PLDc N-terminal domain-containing protein [Actinomycetota bacterium]